MWARCCRDGESPQPELLAQLAPHQLPSTGLTVRVHDAPVSTDAPNVVCTTCMGDPAVRARVTPEPPLATVVTTTEDTSAASGVPIALAGGCFADAQSVPQPVAPAAPGAAMVASVDMEHQDVFENYQRMMQQARSLEDEAELAALVDGASPNASMLFNGNEMVEGLLGEWGEAMKPSDGMLEPWSIGVGGQPHELDAVSTYML